MPCRPASEQGTEAMIEFDIEEQPAPIALCSNMIRAL